MELTAEFDPFLAGHIAQYGNRGKGNTSCLSFSTYEGIISIMGKTVSEEIVESKYFSIIVDSTPDVSHCDQLSFIIRYVNRNGLPRERFLEFIRNTGHTGEELADSVLKFLDSHG
jgi:hypothetical protein